MYEEEGLSLKLFTDTAAELHIGNAVFMHVRVPVVCRSYA